MQYHLLDCGDVAAVANASCFVGRDGVREYHVYVRPVEYAHAGTQLAWIEDAYHRALAALGVDRGTAVLRRFYCSDLANQAGHLRCRNFSNPRSETEPCAVSWVCQPPMPPAKVSMWAYHVEDSREKLAKAVDNGSFKVTRGGLSHVWNTGMCDTSGFTSYEQTRNVFAHYNRFLAGRNLRLSDHVIRTWLFLQDVDINYQGLVDARREMFAECGLTHDTHYIASTGVGGAGEDPRALVHMDGYAISGVLPEQIAYLEDLERLSPTDLYGVTFERGTSVAYRDRKQIFISGTASIDRDGEIVHPGDVARQLDRTLENVEGLLARAGATLGDMASFMVYIRDPADYELARSVMRERFGHAPMEVVEAPVCRPGWLIEVEGIAIVSADNPGLPVF